MFARTWRAALVYTHRWLGIAGCLLFTAWFASGIVMMYARMPSLAPEEKLARAADLDLSGVTISPSEAATRAGVSVDDVQIAMLRGRPVYRFAPGGAAARSRRAAAGPAPLFADTGESWRDTGIDAARAAARSFEPAYTGELRDDGFITEPDQWTIQTRASLPMYRFALDDASATRLYVSATTGEVVLRTTRKERFWGYLGPVIHWIYFTPLRRNGPLWTEVIIWTSLAGCLMCATGLVWGAIRFSPSARFRLKRVQSRSPYAGWMKWHHFSGLIFGVVTLTWIYSGLLSMGPFNWFRPVGGGRNQAREARQNAEPSPPSPLTITVEQLRAAHTAFSREFTPKALRMARIDGQHYWLAEQPPSLADADRWRSPSLLPRTFRPRLRKAYVSAAHPERSPFDRFPVDTLNAAAHDAMGNTPVAESAWLSAYDGYYYDGRGADPLPVLRIRYADPQETWLYLDPATGGVVQRSEKVTRLHRWLYQGFHSLDFPFLYYRRPLWDIVVITLSLGGVALSATTMAPAWRRLMNVRLVRRG